MVFGSVGRCPATAAQLNFVLVKAQKERKKSEIGFDSQSPSDATANKLENDPRIVPITWGQAIPRDLPRLTEEEIFAEVMAMDDNVEDVA